jgi:cobalt/nickel transport system permease protein
MHIPDGFLALNTWLPTWVISIGGIGYCVRKTSHLLKEKTVPLMGIMSAFIFAAQMLNFPVAGGTSGHLLGGVLAAVLLGPYAGAIVLSVVLTAQCLIFQDGGLTALGANIFNMAIVGTIGGYLIYSAIHKFAKGKTGMITATAIAAWLSVVLASSACAVELAISGTIPLNVALPAMAGIHSLIGLGEAVITCLVVSFVLGVRPDLIYGKEQPA